MRWPARTFAGAVAVAGGAGALVWSGRRRVLEAAACLSASLVLIIWCVVLCTLPDFERYKPVRPFSELNSRARERRGHRGIVQVRAAEHGLLPASPRDGGAAARSSSGRVSLDERRVLRDDRERVREYQDRLPVETHVLARQPMFDIKARNFLDGSALPQFVLVSNRE
jgi:hypothetical protein